MGPFPSRERRRCVALLQARRVRTRVGVPLGRCVRGGARGARAGGATRAVRGGGKRLARRARALPAASRARILRPEPLISPLRCTLVLFGCGRAEGWEEGQCLRVRHGCRAKAIVWLID